MNEEKKIIYGLDEIETVVDSLISVMGQCQIFTFTGSLGAGKTTLIRAILRKCGVAEGVITSPTFTYLNLYENQRGQTFYHFDLYRIEKLEEFLAAGFNEYLYVPNSWVFIEWPEPILSLLKKNVCHCSIEYQGENKREITCSVIE